MRRPRNGKREVSIFYALTRTVPARIAVTLYLFNLLNTHLEPYTQEQRVKNLSFI